MDSLAAPVPRASGWSDTSVLLVPRVRAHTRAMALTAAIILAASFRTMSLSTYGFSDDEINKVNAIAEYRAGNFSANAEHPMLMKVAMWGSLTLADGWNRIAGPSHRIPLESAVRLPNALAGAATTAALFGVTELLFGTGTAILGSFFWALDVNATATNRLGKEDTFLLLFFLLAVWCYERGKKRGVADPAAAQSWYAASGAMFGFMIASKYMAYYWALYGLFNTVSDVSPGANKPDKGRFYAAMGLAFLAANFAILIPSTWTYLIGYVNGDTVTHHGYMFLHRLYVTDVPISTAGVPAGFYLYYLATKIPIVLLIAAAAGLVETARRREERGFIFLRVMFVFLLLGYSLFAVKFVRYILPLLAIIDISAAIGVIAMFRWIHRLRLSPASRLAACGALAASIVAVLLSAEVAATPFYSFAENSIGQRVTPPGQNFPDDEFYDYGVREAVAAIAREASSGATIVSDVPDVAAYYIRAAGRRDLRVRSLSQEGLPPQPLQEAQGTAEAWVIVQEGHVYFDNREIVAALRCSGPPWREIHARDAIAVEIYRLPRR
jgi:dolichyl-phosphate-mannose-protein mannosyltransferase